MPKISALPAAGPLSGTEQIPLVQSGLTVAGTVQAIANIAGGLGYYNVKSYGAIGNGVVNDTTAIQNAINAAGAAGGGIVFMPPGTYIIQPATNVVNSFALQINFDKVTLMGAGRDQTKLVFKLFNGGDPTTSLPLPTVSSVVQRGFAIQITGTGTATARHDIKFMDFELDGGVANQSSNAVVDATTGIGQDVSHKGIYHDHDQVIDQISIERCYLHKFAGEIIHYGGANFTDVLIRDCKIGDTNLDGISMSCRNLVVDNNEIFSCYNSAVENSYFDGYNIYRNNYFHDCTFGGLQVFPAVQTVLTGIADIHDNRFDTVGAGSTGCMYLQGARNMRVYNNLIIDCARGIYCISPGLGGSGTQSIPAENISIFNNRFVCRNVSITWCIGLYAAFSGTPFKRLHVYNNQAVRMQSAIDAGKTITSMIDGGDFGFNLTFGADHWFFNNKCWGGLKDDDSGSKADVYYATTSMATVVSRAVSYHRSHKISVSWRVYTAATTLTVNVLWTDQNNVAQSKTLVSGSQAVGAYHTVFEVSPDGVPTTYGSIVVQAQAGNNTNIIMSAEIYD